MSATSNPRTSSWAGIPELKFAITAAEPLRYAAVPTLRFAVGIEAPEAQEIRSVLLDVQIQIAARQRGYGATEEELLRDLFGAADRWGSTLRTLPWVRTTVVVPPFECSTEAEVLVPCSYDLEVSGARYLAGLTDGTVPLEFMFSGSVFFATPDGRLQMARIATDCEATYQLPVATWRAAMDRHFPDSAWVRISRERFEALSAYRARHAFASWDAAFDELLKGRGSD
jgi:hypothetical protein